MIPTDYTTRPQRIMIDGRCWDCLGCLSLSACCFDPDRTAPRGPVIRAFTVAGLLTFAGPTALARWRECTKRPVDRCPTDTPFDCAPLRTLTPTNTRG